MKNEFEKLHSQVMGVANKFTGASKRKELDQIFEILAKELSHNQVQSQRIMALLRMIMVHQPGSSKAVNEFLKSPNVASKMHHGGGYSMG